ncbi:MAG: Hpt domain-containing protein, partial [Hafnia sp.]
KSQTQPTTMPVLESCRSESSAEQPCQESQAEDTLFTAENFPTLDILEGLNRIHDNTALYKKLLLSFADRHNNSARIIRQHLEHPEENTDGKSTNINEYPLYITHTLKGIAGNLGAKELMQAANALEQALKESATSKKTFEMLEHYELSLNTLVSCIKKTLHADSKHAIVKNSEEIIDTSTTVQFLKSLPALTEHDWTQAQAKTEQLGTLLSAQYPELIQQLINAVDEFDSQKVAEVARVLQNLLETPHVE